MVVRLLQNIFWAYEHKEKKATVDFNAHHLLARRAAAESIVLLKNKQDLLPIVSQKYTKILVVGGFAEVPSFQGSGSAHVNPLHIDIPLEEIRKAASDFFKVSYAQGYKDDDKVDHGLIEQVCRLAADVDIVVVLGGLPEMCEAEGYDRTDMELPESHNKLITELARIHSRLVVVLQNGSAVTMPWLDNAAAVLEAGLGGQAVGGAIADVLFGKFNPCGKLAETFPLRLEDTPAFLNWPGKEGRINYGEGVFVGYRYYEKKKIAPLFVFGHGLSYTSFEYDNLKIEKSVIENNDTLTLTCNVKNSGNRTGKEVVQLYSGPETQGPHRPLKRLVGFKKIELKPTKQKTVCFTLTTDDFACFSAYKSQWVTYAGKYTLAVGSSSSDIRLSQNIQITGTENQDVELTSYSTFKEWLRHPQGKELIKPIINRMLQMQPQDKQKEYVLNMMADVPLCKMTQFSMGHLTEQIINDIVKQLE